MRPTFEFRENPDELHCLQCSVGMLLEALCSENLNEHALERLTDFTPGEESWPYATMLALASRGLYVTDVERFDPEAFVRDPRAALMEQAQDEAVVDRVFEVSNVPEQVALVRQCLADPHISFQERVPDLSELAAALGEGAFLLVNVNARKLREAEGYAGHIMFVHGYSDGTLAVEDPGPPARAGLLIGAEAFEAAWKSPTDGMANYIAVSQAPLGATRST
jgi:hypothetical protein